MKKTVENYMAAIEQSLEKWAPDNIAPIPIATSKEDGHWFVFISIRRPERSDFSIEVSDPSLLHALIKTYHTLCRMTFVERQAIHTDATFGITYADALPAG